MRMGTAQSTSPEAPRLLPGLPRPYSGPGVFGGRGRTRDWVPEGSLAGFVGVRF